MGLVTAYIIFLGLFGLLALLSSSNRYVQGILVAAFLMLSVNTYFAYFDILSRPKDVDLEFLRNDESVKVRAFDIVPGEALYVLIQLNGIKEPRYYRFPWSEQTQKIAKALQEGNESGQGMNIGKPFERSLSEQRMAYPDPQIQMPPKQAPETNILSNPINSLEF